MESLQRHHSELREEDGAVEWERLLIHFERSYFRKDVSKGPQEWIDRQETARRRYSSIV